MQRTHGEMITSLYAKTTSQRRFDVIIALLLRHVSAGYYILVPLFCGFVSRALFWPWDLMDHTILLSMCTPITLCGPLTWITTNCTLIAIYAPVMLAHHMKTKLLDKNISRLFRCGEALTLKTVVSIGFCGYYHRVALVWFAWGGPHTAQGFVSHSKSLKMARGVSKTHMSS